MRRRARIRWIVVSLWRAGQRWVSHECVDLSAAFAYFTLQSIFPLLLIALSVFANVIGKADSRVRDGSKWDHTAMNTRIKIIPKV